MRKQEWELGAKNMWADGKWNPELEDMLKEGWEPFAAVTNVYGSQAGSFIFEAGVTESQPIILFRRKKDE